MTSQRRYRYLLCIPDGAAEDPCPELDGRTPQQAAHMPTLSTLAKSSRTGWAQTIPDNLPPASDVGIMSILGYDPRRYHTGRAPLEAAALNIALPDDRIVFRANLVTVSDDGTMVDFTGGHPTQDQAQQAMSRLQQHLGGEVTFHAGLGYRNLMTAPASWGEASCTPPHELVGCPAIHPRGQAAHGLIKIMTASRELLSEYPLGANQIWLWGQGHATQLPTLQDKHGITGAMVAAVTIARGIGALAGMTATGVPGATGWYDTNYEAKRDAAIAAFRSGAGLVAVHVAATDEAGHAGDLNAKIDALERWDQRILQGLTAYLDTTGPWRMLWIPDHATSTRLRAHTRQPVPYLHYDSQARVAQHGCEAIPATDLLPLLVG